MITTSSNEINWMAEKATKYFSDGFDTVYQFKGTIPFHMLRSAQGWMKAQNAARTDGRSRTSLGMVLVEKIDLEKKTYYKESINLAFGNFKSTNTTVEFQVTISSYALSEEDMAELTK